MITKPAPSQFTAETLSRFGVIPDPPVGEYTKAFHEWLNSLLAAGIKVAELDANEPSNDN